MSNSIFLVNGFHHHIPGVQLKACATAALADTAAADMVNMLLDDVELPKNATAENWQDKLQAYNSKRAEDLDTDVDLLDDDNCGRVNVDTVDLEGLTNHPQLVADLWSKIEDDRGDFFDLRARVRGAIWHGETETPVAAGIKPLVFEQENFVDGGEFLQAVGANGDYAIIRVSSSAVELRLSGIAIGGKNFESAEAAMKAAGEHYAAHMQKFVNGVTATINPMRLSDGSTDYFVDLVSEDRRASTSMYKIEGRALYDLAIWNWIFQGGPKPDLLAYDTDGKLVSELEATISSELATIELMRPDAVAEPEEEETPNYRAVVTVTTAYFVEVAAESKDDAREAAGEVLANSEDPDKDFAILSTDTVVESVETI